MTGGPSQTTKHSIRARYSTSSAAPPSTAATATLTCVRSAAPLDGAAPISSDAEVLLALVDEAWVAVVDDSVTVPVVVVLGVPVTVCVATRMTVRVDVKVLMALDCAATMLTPVARSAMSDSCMVVCGMR